MSDAGRWAVSVAVYLFSDGLHAGCRVLLFCFFCQKGTQFLHRFGFYLADAFGGNAVFGSQFVQSQPELVAFLEPVKEGARLRGCG